MVTIYVRWQLPVGWTFAVYQVSDGDEAHHTILPIEMEALSKACPGFSDDDRDAVDRERERVTTALTARYPEARVEFVDVPRGL